MTPRAKQLEQALSALVSAVDAYQQHGRKRPLDGAGMCHLGLAVDESAKKIPASIVRAIVRHLSENPDDLSASE